MKIDMRFPTMKSLRVTIKCGQQSVIPTDRGGRTTPPPYLPNKTPTPTSSDHILTPNINLQQDERPIRPQQKWQKVGRTRTRTGVTGSSDCQSESDVITNYTIQPWDELAEMESKEGRLLQLHPHRGEQHQHQSYSLRIICKKGAPPSCLLRRRGRFIKMV